MKKFQYEVDGLVNAQLKTQVKNALDKVKGVQQVGISLENGSIVVEYNEPADESQIKACIEKTGLTLQ